MTYKYKYSHIGVFEIYVKKERYLKMLHYFNSDAPEYTFEENGYVYINGYDLLRCIVSGVQSDKIEYYLENKAGRYFFDFRYPNTVIRRHTTDFYDIIHHNKINTPLKAIWFIIKTTLEVKRLFREIHAEYNHKKKLQKLKFLWR